MDSQFLDFADVFWKFGKNRGLAPRGLPPLLVDNTGSTTDA